MVDVEDKRLKKILKIFYAIKYKSEYKTHFSKCNFYGSSSD